MIKMIMVMIMAMTMMTMMMMMIKLIILRVSANARMATRHICKMETFSFPSFQRVMVRNIVTFTSHIFLYRTYIVKRHDAHERNCQNWLWMSWSTEPILDSLGPVNLCNGSNNDLFAIYIILLWCARYLTPKQLGKDRQKKKGN